MTDAATFEAFVLRYQDMVYATAVRLLGRPADAEDAAQTVFLKAFQRFDEIGASPTAAGWLKTVTTNVCLNHLSRYRSRWRFFSELARTDEAGEDTAFEERVASADVTDAALDESADRERLEAALRRLPTPQRVPLVLFHFEHKSYQEIAVLLDVSLAKVKTDIHRARVALRAHLGGRR